MPTGIEQLLAALGGQQIQDIEDSLVDLLDRLNIDTMEGDNLDAIGVIVGQNRQGFTDAKYRLFLQAKILQNSSEGEMEKLLQAWLLVTVGTSVAVIEIFPAEVTLYSDVAVPGDEFDLLFNMAGDIVSAGVSVGGFGVFPEAGTFGFSPDSLGFSSDGTTDGGKFYNKQVGS